MALRRLIHADAALWAYAWTTIQDTWGLKHKVGTTTWAHIAKGEYANDANGEKGEDGHPEVIDQPGVRSPTPGQDTDGHQARPQKQVPPSQRLPYGGHGLGHRLIMVQAAMRAKRLGHQDIATILAFVFLI
jgi:hypothetical protein